MAIPRPLHALRERRMEAAVIAHAEAASQRVADCFDKPVPYFDYFAGHPPRGYNTAQFADRIGKSTESLLGDIGIFGVFYSEVMSRQATANANADVHPYFERPNTVVIFEQRLSVFATDEL